MAPRKKVESTDVTVPAQSGELLPAMDLSKSLGSITNAGTALITQIVDEYATLPTGDKLTALAATIKGNEQLKAFTKQCSSLRTSLTNAHKDAKAPWLDATRKLDARLKELTEQVKKVEDPVKAALQAESDKAAKLLADANNARLAELEAENAALKAKMVQENVMPLMEDKQVVVVIRGRESSKAARLLFTDGVYDELKTDAQGTPYTLEVVLRRKGVQDA
jgi:hypothetical protein